MTLEDIVLETYGVLEVKTLLKTITSGTWTSAPDYRPNVAVVQYPLRVRDLMPNLETSSNLVEAPVEASQTGTVDYQTNEGDAKAVLDFTYQLRTFPVATIAAIVHASRQVVDDSKAFSGYIDTRLTYLVEQKVEKELLYGNGATGHITGLTVNANAGGTGTTSLDKIASSLGALATAGVIPDGIVLNPTDWVTLVSTKNASGVYPAAEPMSLVRPFSLFGFPVALSTQITAGNYLVGAFQTFAALFNRQNATIEIARSHDLNFTKNLVSIRAEERVALAIYKPTAFTYGAL